MYNHVTEYIDVSPTRYITNLCKVQSHSRIYDCVLIQVIVVVAVKPRKADKELQTATL